MLDKARKQNFHLEQENQPTPFKATGKVGRNDPCPCGSGKKYKNAAD